MPNIIKQRYLKIDLDICVLNYKLAKQSKANLDQATNANLDTNKPKEQKQLFKIPNNPNSIKAFLWILTQTKPIWNNYGVNLAKTLSGLKIPFQELNAYKSSLFLKHLSYVKQRSHKLGISNYCAHLLRKTLRTSIQMRLLCKHIHSK